MHQPADNDWNTGSAARRPPSVSDVMTYAATIPINRRRQQTRRETRTVTHGLRAGAEKRRLRFAPDRIARARNASGSEIVVELFAACGREQRLPRGRLDGSSVNRSDTAVAHGHVDLVIETAQR